MARCSRSHLAISDVAFPTAADRANELSPPDAATARNIRKQAVLREKSALEPLAALQQSAWTRAACHFREARGPFEITYGTRNVWRSRIMTKLQYGLVNVRTDGNEIVCATMKESGEGWTIHKFNARFLAADYVRPPQPSSHRICQARKKNPNRNFKAVPRK
jgi:hypothetical protein